MYYFQYTYIEYVKVLKMKNFFICTRFQYTYYEYIVFTSLPISTNMNRNCNGSAT